MKLGWTFDYDTDKFFDHIAFPSRYKDTVLEVLWMASWRGEERPMGDGD